LFRRHQDLMRGRLSLLISHLFNTVRFADRIVVLENGRLIEDGPYDELLLLGGRYAAMFNSQASAYRPEAAKSAS
jgi:ATP-binding cassette subfamily B protein